MEKKDKDSKKKKKILKPKGTPFKKPGWTNPNCTFRGSQRTWPPLKQILISEDYSKIPPNIATYSSIEASSAVLYPPKKYCDLTGFVAPYTDPKTQLRFASAEVYQWIHRNLTTEDIQQYLSLRRAFARLK